MADPVEAHKSYIVVLNPECLGSLYGDTSRAIVCADKIVTYRGIDRDPWWNLDKLFYADRLDAEFATLRPTIERSGLEEFSPGVCDSLDVALRVQALSATQPLKDEIIRIARASDVVDEAACFFGYDCYVDGFGSPLRLGIFSATTVFADYENQLNECGLFPSLNVLRDYIEAYCERCEEANLEVIEPYQISNAYLFQIWGVSIPNSPHHHDPRYNNPM